MLSQEKQDALRKIETHWHYRNKLLTAGIPKLYWQDPNFVKAIRERGIPYRSAIGEIVTSTASGPPVGPKFSSGDVPDLDDQQLAAITTITNFDDRRSRSAKLQDLGISSAKFAGWMRDPEFKEVLQKISNEVIQDSVHIANEGLLKAVDRGDTNAVKYWREVTGRASSQTELNLRLVLQRLVESIQRHVKDEAVLRSIQEDFSRITAGEAAAELPPAPVRLGDLI